MSEQEPINRAKLYAKMARVMGKLNRVQETGRNKFHNYNYATAADVADAIRNHMSEEGIAFIPHIAAIGNENGVYLVEYDFTLACSETGATITTRWAAESSNTNSKGGPDDKALNKCHTTAAKTFLMRTFIMSAGDEPDRDGEEERPPAEQKPRTVQIPRIEYTLARDGKKKYITCEIDGGGKALSWERTPFVTAKAIPDKDLLQEPGDWITFDPPLKATITSEMKDGREYFKLAQLDTVDKPPAIVSGGGNPQPQQEADEEPEAPLPKSA